MLLLEIIEPPPEEEKVDAELALRVETDGLSEEESKAGTVLQAYVLATNVSSAQEANEKIKDQSRIIK